MTSYLPGFHNVFVPEAQRKLQSDLTRDPSQFKVNQYVTNVVVDKTIGYAIIHSPDESSRIQDTDGREFLWADGADAPINHWQGQEFVEYRTQRYGFGFTVGDQTEKQALWSVIANHAKGAASRAMLNRTIQVLNALGTSGNYASGFTNTCATWSGGRWDAGSTTTPYLKAGIQAGLETLVKGSNGTISPKQTALVISPSLAHQISQSAEVIDHVKNNMYGMSMLQGSDNFTLWSLPDAIYGVKIIVEDAVMNTAAHNATRVGAFAAGDDAYLIVRPGEMMGDLNTMSSITLPIFEEVSVFTEYSALHRRTIGVVTDDFGVVMRPNLAIRFTDCST